jgi:hypothetical protein
MRFEMYRGIDGTKKVGKIIARRKRKKDGQDQAPF